MHGHSGVSLASLVLMIGLLADNSARAVTITDLGTFGTPGTGPGQLAGPNGIAAADDGTIYVADTYNARVQIFSPTGVALGGFGAAGSSPGQFLFPYGIDVSSVGEVFVGDLNRRDVQVFSASGTFLRSFGSGILSEPFGLWVSDGGLVFVTDRPAGLVRKFTAAGAYLGSFGAGFGGNSLIAPQNVEGDGSGTLYISDGSGAMRIRTCSESGAFIDTFGSWINNPTGAALAGGRMYLTEYAVGRLDVVDLATRALVDVLGYDENYTFNVPFDAATVGDSLLYVLEAGGGRVHRFGLGVGLSDPPVVQAIAPNGGESFATGTGVPVSWSATDDLGVASVSLLLSRDAGASFLPIAAGLPNSGSYVWTAIGPGSAQCRLKVRAIDGGGQPGEDDSDGDFSLVAVPPTVHVDAPNGGESFVVGDPVQISWTATDDVAVTSITILLSLDGGANYSVVAGPLPNTGTYSWVSSMPGSNQCRIKVQARDGGGDVSEDDSDGVFTLVGPTPSPPLTMQPAGSIGSGGAQDGQFSGPDGIAVSPDGFLWVADTYNSRVQKFSLAGEHLLTFGGPGTLPGQFSRPYGIDVDADGFVYVSDLDRANVQKFDSGGNFVATIGSGILAQPFGLWVGGGVLYVTDRPAHRVRRFTTDGTPLEDIGPTVGDISLALPQNIEGDGHGRLYISDGVGRIRIVTTGADWVTEFGAPWIGNPTGAAFLAGHYFLTEYSLNRVSDVDVPTLTHVNILGDDESYLLNTPLDAAASGDSLLFILDTGNNRIVRLRARPGVTTTARVLAPNGGEQVLVGSSVELRWSATPEEHIVSIDLLLSRDAGVSYQTVATGVANTGSYVWVANPPASTECRLLIIAHDALGGTVEDLSDNAWTLVPATAPPYGMVLGETFGGAGQANGQFGGPDGIATSDDGFVYVADTYNSRVQKFTRTGVHVATFGVAGNGPGQLQRPYGIDVDAQGNVYVSDFGTRRVQKFSSDGQYLRRLGATVEFLEPLGLWVSDSGVLYVTDRAAHVVRLFHADTGEQITVWGPTLDNVTLSFPQNIEGDGDGLFYISDGHAAFRVREVDGGGHHVESFGSPWIGNPTGAALAGSRMFLTEYNLNRFSVVDLLTTSQIDVWGDLGDPISFNSPIDAASLGDSLLYVLDTGNNRVVIFHLPALTPPEVTVLVPNGGETLFIGDVQSLHWNAVDDNEVASVDILISRDGGLNFSVLATRLPNDGNYPWTVSPPVSTQCLVRVIGRDPEGGVGSDLSNSVFAITGGPTPTMVIQLSVESRVNGLAVRWQLADPALQAGSWLERADEQGGGFSRVSVERTEDARGAIALDRSVAEDHTYWYRVVARSGDRQWSFGPVEATAHEVITVFALSAPRPNPAADRTTLRFALPQESDIRLSLHDVQGRELTAPIHDHRPAGRYDVLLDLRDGSAPAAPGLYFVRLQVNGRPAMTRRLVVQR